MLDFKRIIFLIFPMPKKTHSIDENDANYVPYERTKANRKKIATARDDLNFNIWLVEEEKLYIQYLQEHILLFQTVQTRKKNKVFINMGKYIKSRSSDQCRSHHQKMTKKYGDTLEIIEGIISNKLNKPEQGQENESISQNSNKKNPLEPTEIERRDFKSSIAVQEKKQVNFCQKLKFEMDQVHTFTSLTEYSKIISKEDMIMKEVQEISAQKENSDLWQLINQSFWVKDFY